MGIPLNVGIIGCGAIIAQYLTNFRRLDAINLVAVADLDPARAQAVADSYDGVRALTVDELLAADDVELVLNLTIPAAHADVALKAIAAGKSVYGEKPLAATTAEAPASTRRRRRGRRGCRLRSRHRAGYRHPDSAQSDRRRPDWRSGFGDRHHGYARA
ncbi:hypothetical protein StoSoilB13_38440 (plasmid) [Arthrobacter sp. StoSoilB13]|nr:hypothetical protein StoSoilB13_38440 [Arthrobacter sp. StoSoilB13]